MTRTMNSRTCPNIRDLILKCTKTHESARLGLRTHARYASSSWRYIQYWGSGERRPRERIVIKQSNAAQKSKNQIPLAIPPYHTTPKKNQNNQKNGSIPREMCHMTHNPVRLTREQWRCVRYKAPKGLAPQRFRLPDCTMGIHSSGSASSSPSTTVASRMTAS